MACAWSRSDLMVAVIPFDFKIFGSRKQVLNFVCGENGGSVKVTFSHCYSQLLTSVVIIASHTPRT